MRTRSSSDLATLTQSLPLLVLTLTMKLFIASLTFFFLVSCSQPANDNANAKANLAAKNKETAAKNEMIKLVEEAQKLEQEGRDMEIYRKFPGSACGKALAKKTVKLQEFQTKLDGLTENYKSKLAPIFEDLSKCVACEKTAMDSCRTTRASLNQLIKEVFSQ